MSHRRTLYALRRMWLSIVVVFAALAALGLAAVASLPSTWTSVSRIAIERPEAPVGTVPENAQELLYQRVELLRASILSPDGLERIAREQGFSVEGAEGQEADIAAAAALAERLDIEVENTSVVNRYTGKLGLLPLAIRVSFEGRSPEEAHRMAEAFTDRALALSRGRESDANRYRTGFLDDEVEREAERLESIERRIADFAAENALLMPDLRELTVRRIEDTDAALARSAETLAGLEQSAAQSAAELATTSPEALLFAEDGTRIESPAERLERRQVELAAARARYSEAHPEVRRLARDVEALARSVGGVDTAPLERERDAAIEALARARETYAESHPSVTRLVDRIDALERALERAEAVGAAPARTSVPSSPAYNRLLARRDSIAEGIARERARAAELEAELETLTERLRAMPATESRYLALEREREDALAAYLQRQEAASSAALDAGLREAALLETLTLVAAPRVPKAPSSPNRPLLTALAVLFAALVSITVALARALAGDRIYEDDLIRLRGRAAVHSIPAC